MSGGKQRKFSPPIRPADIDPLAERTHIQHEQGTNDYERQTAVSDSMPFATHPFNLTPRAQADVLLEQLWARGWQVIPIPPQCCCSWGAAIKGEWPEFECGACPVHKQGLGPVKERCRRHS